MKFQSVSEWFVAARSAILTGFVVAALCFPLGYCQGYKAASAKAAAERALANVKALELDAMAKDAAASERVADALVVEEMEEELLDAIAQTPDSAPDAVRVQLGCRRLRAQGTPAADIPAICGP